MARPVPFLPEPERTLLLFGDAHHGLVWPDRVAKAAQTYGRNPGHMPRVAGVVQLGDMTNDSQPGEFTLATAWRSTFPGGMETVIGNHDLHAPATTADWAAQFGYTGIDYTLDFGFVRVIATGFGNNSPNTNAPMNLSYVTAQLQAATAAGVPAIIAQHKPPYGQTDPGVAPHDNLTGSAYTLQQVDTTALFAACDPYPIAKALIHGHTHSWFDSPAFAVPLSTGSRNIASVNTGSLAYLTSGKRFFSDPVFGVYLTLPAAFPNRVEVRIGDLGAGVWMTDQTKVIDL